MMNLATKFKSITRRLIVSVYHKFPGIKNKIGLPSDFYPSTTIWATQEHQHEGLDVTTQEIYPAHELQRSHPKTIESEIHKNFHLSNVNYSFSSAPVGVTEAKSDKPMRLWGPNAAVITPDDQLLGDAPGEFYVDPSQSQAHSIFLQWRLPERSSLSGRVAALATPGSHSYFHWMLNALPRFHLLQAGGISLDSISCFILSQNCNTQFHQETLKALNIPWEKVSLASWQFHAQLNHLVIPSVLCLPAESTPEDTLRYRKYGSFTGNIPRWACEFVRTVFLPDSGAISEKPNSKRLYITRKVSIRRVLNEAEVIDLLSRYGFEVVDLAEISISEQAALMASAEAIIAVHGAGLTNLTFCTEGAKVIEIFAKNYVKLTYWGLCNLMHLDYYYFLGDAEQDVDEADDYAAREQDVIIPVQKLLDTLKLAELI